MCVAVAEASGGAPGPGEGDQPAGSGGRAGETTRGRDERKREPC